MFLDYAVLQVHSREEYTQEVLRDIGATRTIATRKKTLQNATWVSAGIVHLSGSFDYVVVNIIYIFYIISLSLLCS